MSINAPPLSPPKPHPRHASPLPFQCGAKLGSRRGDSIPIASPFWAQHYRLPLDDDSAAGLAKGLSAADPTEAVAKAVGALPEDRRSLLTATCALLTKVAASEKTKMSVATLRRVAQSH